MIFDGFALERVDVGSGIRLRVRPAGRGTSSCCRPPPNPTTWWQVAPLADAASPWWRPIYPGMANRLARRQQQTLAVLQARYGRQYCQADGQLGHDAYAVADTTAAPTSPIGSPSTSPTGYENW